MRPYQIVATEKILSKIQFAYNQKKYGTIDAGGYVRHTTGSGKTLTSFKTAQLVSKLPYIDKVLFVVDRKDLDYQTMKEYDKFQKGAANSNTSTAILKKQLEDQKAKIIITTIQKLDIFIKKNKGHEIFDGHIVLIFDECHRSQFGNMHQAIIKAFKKYYIFGFTGTPIFAANANTSGNQRFKTTEQIFGQKLHTYTIVNAIKDKNVLPFKVDYVATIKEKENIDDEKVIDIDREKALTDPRRISNIVRYILEHFDQKTKRNTKFYEFDRIQHVEKIACLKNRKHVEEIKEKVRLSGFNALFAVASIEMAKLYYYEFKKQMAQLPEIKKLKIATIFSYTTNEEELDGTIEENPENTNCLDKNSKDFLEEAIADYNAMFGTSYDTSPEKFQNYYKDVSLRMKNREIDLLIVVNMFLTGFDAVTLNTLWVDKNLRLHGLLQAFSRTNRIFNSIKTHGNIICFRNLEKRTNEAIALFGDENASSIVLIKNFEEYYNGYREAKKQIPGYKTLVKELQKKFPLSKTITGEREKKEFIKLYGSILKLHNILTTFDEFAGKEILTERDFQDYQSVYLDLHQEFRKTNEGEKEIINDDLIFEIELIKQVEINIDYILALIKKYHQDHVKNKEILIDIRKAINASMELRSKKELIEHFIQSLNENSNVDEDWIVFVEKRKKEELEKIIEEENLNRKETYKFMQKSFKNGFVKTIGGDVAKILPPISRFDPNNERSKKKEKILTKLINFFEKFFTISQATIEYEHMEDEGNEKENA